MADIHSTIYGKTLAHIDYGGMTINIPAETWRLDKALAVVQMPQTIEGHELENPVPGIGQGELGVEIPVHVEVEIEWPTAVVAILQHARRKVKENADEWKRKNEELDAEFPGVGGDVREDEWPEEFAERYYAIDREYTRAQEELTERIYAEIERWAERSSA